MWLHHEIQDYIEDDTIHLDGIKKNANNELQIYMDPFLSHYANMVIDPTDSVTQPKAYVNMVMVTSTAPPAPDSRDITFT